MSLKPALFKKPKFALAKGAPFSLTASPAIVSLALAVILSGWVSKLADCILTPTNGSVPVDSPVEALMRMKVENLLLNIFLKKKEWGFKRFL